jgi:T-complex protein 1 subunit delta
MTTFTLLQAAKTAGGPTRVEKAKIGLIQFHVSPPKSDIENTVVISDYAQVGFRAHA